MLPNFSLLPMTKLAFVTPWFGPGIPGGSEAEARRLVNHLHEAGFAVEVLTTCIQDFHADWGKNYHRPGVEQINGITVRRFPVLPRDKEAFSQVNWRLMHNLPITAVQEQIYINQMFQVPTLFDYIQQQTQPMLFIFIPYMFATTYHGAKIHPERSIIIPCLHDESYARLGIYQEVLPTVRGLVLHVESELSLANQLYGSANGQIRAVLGEGVDTDFVADGRRFREKYQLDGPFILYAGRREMGKNVPLLLQFWQRYHQENGRSAHLVLIGPGKTDVPPEASIIDLGFVSAQDKYDAYAAANIFCLPSTNESFSIVTMESWLTETPVLVHGYCAVTREHCLNSNGGLYFTNYEEFAATVDYLLDNPLIAQQMGKNGRQYVLANYQWPTVIDKYKQLINTIAAELDT